MSHILLAEDDANVAALLRAYLERDGFRLTVHADGPSALCNVLALQPDLLLLDIMLPGMDGWEICRQVRQQSAVPTIILTARIDEADRIAGLRLGADDYIMKPFSPAEVVERVKAVLRRGQAFTPVESERVLRHAGVTLTPSRFEVLINGSALALTLSEFRILEIMLSAPGRVFTRDRLLEVLSKSESDVIDRAIDVHIVNLRRKLEARIPGTRLIETVRSIGYRLRREDENE
ncbi:MAG: response regulator transcription factor [Alphaproteobacteria bacterium]|nr:response regulator transcription factor [Alphaproteobacteria bacterium]